MTIPELVARDLVTDEIVELAARAGSDAASSYYFPISWMWDERPEYDGKCERAMKSIRAALEAGIAAILRQSACSFCGGSGRQTHELISEEGTVIASASEECLFCNGTGVDLCALNLG